MKRVYDIGVQGLTWSSMPSSSLSNWAIIRDNSLRMFSISELTESPNSLIVATVMENEIINCNIYTTLITYIVHGKKVRKKNSICCT